jgi:hypothetical protein
MAGMWRTGLLTKGVSSASKNDICCAKSVVGLFRLPDRLSTLLAITYSEGGKGYLEHCQRRPHSAGQASSIWSEFRRQTSHKMRFAAESGHH